MKVGLFVPCYINAIYPQVGVASYKLLKSFGLDVDYPEKQTCCGQPMGNAGFEDMSRKLAKKFEVDFKDFDYIVGPSASCVAYIRDNYKRFFRGETEELVSKVYEICEFIHDIIKPESLKASFPHTVSIQNSCHGVRLLHLSSSSEENKPYYNKLRDLLSLVKGITVKEPEPVDECCGFGGMFSIEETAVANKMGLDKIHHHMDTGAEYITGADSSCLMHQTGLIERNHLPIKTIHIVEILAQGL